MKRTLTEKQKTIKRNLNNSYSAANEQANRTDKTELKYPIGYARPNEKKAWKRFQRNIKKLPQSMANMIRSQEEAAKNGLTEEILNKLLTEDAA